MSAGEPLRLAQAEGNPGLVSHFDFGSSIECGLLWVLFGPQTALMDWTDGLWLPKKLRYVCGVRCGCNRNIYQAVFHSPRRKRSAI